MALRVWVASERDKPALATTYAAYMAEIVPLEIPARNAPYFDTYWQNPDLRLPYLFGDDTVQGFAFVHVLKEPDLDFEMAEFCVYPAFRNEGLGTAALSLVLAHHPGRWEASVLNTNALGQAFWPAALKRLGVRELRYMEDGVARDYRFTAA